MYILNSILLPGLLITGLSVYFQGVNSYNPERLQKFSLLQQHLIAQEPSQDIARRGSGRIETEASS